MAQRSQKVVIDPADIEGHDGTLRHAHDMECDERTGSTSTMAVGFLSIKERSGNRGY